MNTRRVAFWLLPVAAGLAALAAAGLARMAWAPVGLPAPVFPTPETKSIRPVPTCEVSGDPGGHAERAVVKGLSPQARKAFVLLANSEMLCWEVVSSKPRVPETARAFRMLASDPQAAEAFRELVASATLPGQLYGLAGLYLADPAAFAREALRYEHMSDDASVLSQFGCHIDEEAVGPLVRQYFVTGEFSQRLLGRSGSTGR